MALRSDGDVQYEWWLHAGCVGPYNDGVTLTEEEQLMAMAKKVAKKLAAKKVAKFTPKPKKAPTVSTGVRGTNNTAVIRRPKPAGIMESADGSVATAGTVEGVPQYTENPELRKSPFQELVMKIASLDAQIKVAEKLKADLKMDVEILMTVADIDEVAVGPLKVQRISPKPYGRLDKGRLLKAGVTPEQLEAGSIEVKPKSYVKVLAPGMADDVTHEAR